MIIIVRNNVGKAFTDSIIKATISAINKIKLIPPII